MLGGATAGAWRSRLRAQGRRVRDCFGAGTGHALVPAPPTFLTAPRSSSVLFSTPATANVSSPAPNPSSAPANSTTSPTTAIMREIVRVPQSAKFLQRASTPRFQGQHNNVEQQLTRIRAIGSPSDRSMRKSTSELRNATKLTACRVTRLVPPSGRPSPASMASTAPVSTMAPRTCSSSA